MSDQRRRLAIRGVIFVVLVALLFIFSRYIPRPFSAFAPPGEELDDFEGIYSSSDKLGKFLQSLGPYAPAVFVLFQIIQVIAAPFPGELTGVAGGFVIVIFFSFWAKTFGRAQLGRIQGTAQMMTVLASAIGPLILAKCHAWTGSYVAVFYSLAGVVALIGLAAWFVKLPRAQRLSNPGPMET